MSNKFNFTMSRLRAIKPETKRKYYYDQIQPGLRLSVTPTGVKSFQFQMWSKKKNAPVTRTIGKLDLMSIADARVEASQLLARVNKGEDIEETKRERRRQRLLDPTVKEFAEKEFLEKHCKKKKKSWREDERILNKDIIPIIGNLKIKDVKKRDLLKVIDTVTERGKPVMANRVLACLNKMFNYAVERDVLDVSYCQSIKKQGIEKSRDRILSDKEIKKFWKALDNSTLHLMLKFLLVTAQRSSEVRLMKWDEINDDLWTIPSEKSKNKKVHVVPLTDLAKKILAEVSPNKSKNKFVFSSPRKGKYFDKDALPKAMKKIVENLKWKILAKPHDLRRTARSYMSKLGISPLIAGKILNHSDKGMSKVYDRHDYLKEKRAALNKWAKELKKIIN
ncbi:tyrosine-type recombinase/integrase [Thermodesulfobacteriota bacterium]